MKKQNQIADLNCWWNACAQGGFRQDVLFTFVKETLDFLQLDLSSPVGTQAQNVTSQTAA